MTQIEARSALRARLLFPISAPPIEGGVVTLGKGRILAVGCNESGSPPRDLGNVALLPGLVNAHTHLEFSELSQPLGAAGMTLPKWIEAVVTSRRANADLAGAPESHDRRDAAIQNGIRQCLQGGATAIGDIATWDVEPALQSCRPAHYCAFREYIGLSRARVAELSAAAQDFVTSPLPALQHVSRGLSPHAPYTAAWDLVHHLVRLSQQHDLNVAMHVAESREELQLLSDGDGPFRDLLHQFGAWDSAAFPGGRRAIDYLRLLADGHRSLVIHGNFLGPDDWRLLSRHRQTMSVVYCPRTHDYFQHPSYPLGRMLRAGVRVVLGTDGRSSNPDLNLFEELKFAARRHPDIEPQVLLRAVTIEAAAALGLDQELGTLDQGKRADLAVVQLGAHSTARPLESLLHEDSHVESVWVGGIERTCG